MIKPRYKFNKRTNWFIVLLPMVLTGIGILSIASSTSGSAYDNSVIKQIAWLGISLVFMMGVAFIPTEFLRKWSKQIFIVTALACILPKVPGFRMANAPGGALRWVKLGPLAFQPSELLFTAATLKAADMFTKNIQGTSLQKFLVAIALVIGVAAPLIVQPDMGSTIIASACVMGVFMEAVDWFLPIVVGGTAFALAALIAIPIASYRMARLNAWLDPWADPQGKGFQIIQGLIAFSNGGLFGQGLGYGFQKLNYLPAAYTDYIFAAIAEELGFLGAAAVLIIFMAWFWQLFSLYRRVDVRDRFRASLTWGLALSVFLSLTINIAGVTKMIPLTGIAVPFITYGGTSLVSTWIKVGILLRIESDSWEAKENEENE